MIPLPYQIKIAEDLLGTAVYWLPVLALFVVGMHFAKRFRKTIGLGGALLLAAVGAFYISELRRFAADLEVYAAASNGAEERLRAALNAGGSPNVDEPTSGGWPALCAAVDSGSAPCVEALLRRGADPESASWGQGTALHGAKKNRRTDLIRLLQRYGARTDEPGESG